MATAPKFGVAIKSIGDPSPPDTIPDSSELAETALMDLKNYRKLVARVVDVFGDEAKASLWLSTPNSSLDGETPLRVAQRFHYKTLSIEPILTRIEHGIYS